MATVATVQTALETKLVANLTVAAIISNPLWRREAVPVGVTRASVIGVVAGYSGDSNETYVHGNYVITVVHRLTDPTDEDTYLKGDMKTDQAALMLRSFFRSLTGVNEVEVAPEPDEVSRNGNVIEYTVTVQVSISP